MVELYGKHFIYNGTFSRNYGLIFANVETSRYLSISGQKEGRFVFNNAIKARHLVGDKYDDSPLTFEIEIVTCDGHAIEYNEIRQIERWLFVNSTFRKLYIDPADDPFGETTDMVYGVQKNLYFNARFLYPEKIEGNGGVVGFRCMMETDSMMMWQDECKASFDTVPQPVVVVGGKSYTVLRGDVDLDGEITAKDATLVQEAFMRVIQGLPPFDPDDPLKDVRFAAADMNSDESIDAKDATIIQRIYNAEINEEAEEKEYIIVHKDGTIYPTNGDKIITINIDTDIDGYTYPTIIIYGGLTGGYITLRNFDDDENRYTKFEGLTPGTPILLDSSVSRCGIADGSPTVSQNTSLYNKMTIKNFPRLLPGINQIGVNGDVSRVIIIWNNRRFL